MIMWNVHGSYETRFIADIIKLYSAALIAFLLIWNSKVRLIVFGKYNAINDDDAENNHM